jgi:hypothetical protein
VPAFQFVQERYEYNSRTHHSNMDFYDRVQADDMKQIRDGGLGVRVARGHARRDVAPQNAVGARMSSRQLVGFKVGCLPSRFLTAGAPHDGHFLMAPTSDAERSCLRTWKSSRSVCRGTEHTMMDLYKGLSLIYCADAGAHGGLGLIVARRGIQDPTLMLAVPARLQAATW